MISLKRNEISFSIHPKRCIMFPSSLRNSLYSLKNQHFLLACLETLPGVDPGKTRPHSRPSEYINASRKEEMRIAPKYWNPKTNNWLMIRKKKYRTFWGHCCNSCRFPRGLGRFIGFPGERWTLLSRDNQPAKRYFDGDQTAVNSNTSHGFSWKKWVWFNYEENIYLKEKRGKWSAFLSMSSWCLTLVSWSSRLIVAFEYEKNIKKNLFGCVDSGSLL